MRVINRYEVELEITAAWKEGAERALEEVRALSGKPRADAIKGKQDIWKNLKSTLAKISSNKCWYCESDETRSDLAVDHFRPKNSVAEATQGFAYWWLAFDWHNYRYSCTWCNSRRDGEKTKGGKQDHFPLMTEDLRGSPEASVDDLDAKESRKLLDPMDPADVLLLTFDEDGQPASVASREENAVAYERVAVSVELYHLDEEKLCRKRKVKMIEVTRLVRELARNPENKSTFIAIHSRINPKAEHSAACRAAVRTLRGETKFAQALLDL